MKRSLFTLLALLAGIHCFAQGNFSGTWILKEKEALNGQLFANALPTQATYKITVDSLIVESETPGSDGKDVHSRQAFAQNGKPFSFISKSMKRKVTRILEWTADKSGLTLTTVYSLPENETEEDFRRIEKLTLSANGQLICIRTSQETRYDSWEVKGTFDKK